jgi:beta-1,4-N-acetylglucosaminyltransferase
MKPDHRGSICIISSCGGHLTEVRRLKSSFEEYPHYYILNKVVPLDDDMRDCTYFISHAERNWLVVWNIFEIWSILRARRTTLILSTGAGPAVSAAIAGNLMRIPSVFVESVCRVTKPSLTGRIMYYLAKRCVYQWSGLRRFFPNGIYGGPLL